MSADVNEMKKSIYIAAGLTTVLVMAIAIFWLVIGSDLAMSRKIVGTWRGSHERFNPPAHVTVQMSLSDDHHIVLDGSAVKEGLPGAFSATGTWRISGGRLKCKMTSAPQAKEVDSKIFELTEEKLVMQQRDSIGTMYRVTETPNKTQEGIGEEFAEPSE